MKLWATQRASTTLAWLLVKRTFGGGGGWSWTNLAQPHTHPLVWLLVLVFVNPYWANSWGEGLPGERWHHRRVPLSGSGRKTDLIQMGKVKPCTHRLSSPQQCFSQILSVDSRRRSRILFRLFWLRLNLNKNVYNLDGVVNSNLCPKISFLFQTTFARNGCGGVRSSGNHMYWSVMC